MHIAIVHHWATLRNHFLFLNELCSFWTFPFNWFWIDLFKSNNCAGQVVQAAVKCYSDYGTHWIHRVFVLSSHSFGFIFAAYAHTQVELVQPTGARDSFKRFHTLQISLYVYYRSVDNLIQPHFAPWFAFRTVQCYSFGSRPNWCYLLNIWMNKKLYNLIPEHN